MLLRFHPFFYFTASSIEAFFLNVRKMLTAALPENWLSLTHQVISHVIPQHLIFYPDYAKR